MNLRPLLATCLLAAAALPATASRPDPRPAFVPLRGIECLDPDFARSFVPIGDRSLLVDAGHFRYRIETNGSCWALDTTPLIGFRADPISHRVCGTPFDAVLVHGGHPCQIAHMDLLSKDQYKAALREREAWLEERRARRAAARKH